MDYKKSHPWLKFSLSVPLDNFRLWLCLGEIASKVEHLLGVPLRADVAQELHKIYLAKGVQATTAIEGNTLSEEQIHLLIEGKLKVPESQHYLQVEVQNILDICNKETRQLLEGVGEHPGLCVDLIKNYNRDVLKDLELNEGVVPGEIRSHSVVVGNVYRGAPAQDCEYLLEKLCAWLNGNDFVPPNDEEELIIPFALIKAIVAHLYLAWIHPFGDGNGRTARLVEFHILLSAGVPLPATHLLSDHYNLTRTQYYRELAKASAVDDGVISFISYATRGFLDGIREQIKRIREQQLRVAWENYVYDCFRSVKDSKTQKRRRDLVFELTKYDWVKVSEVEMLTPQIARDYAGAGDRMLQRDLNAIHKEGLIYRRHGYVKSAKDMIEAFLPKRVKYEEVDAY